MYVVIYMCNICMLYVVIYICNIYINIVIKDKETDRKETNISKVNNMKIRQVAKEFNNKSDKLKPKVC